MCKGQENHILTLFPLHEGNNDSGDSHSYCVRGYKNMYLIICHELNSKNR